MRILHFYDDTDPIVSQHVKMLTDGMGLEAENHSATEAEQAHTLLRGGQYDILHLHGCWRNASRSIVNTALRKGTRLVLTPHGQLEPWEMAENRWKEKMPKRLLYQRQTVKRSYAVIVQGQMEEECLKQLGWNPRTIVIRNAVITASTTPKDMARQTFAVYRKTMDSNPLALMDKQTINTLRTLLIAGITGDRRWLTSTSQTSTMVPLSTDNWRLLLCYAYQEQITDTLQRGIRTLGLEAPDLDVAKIPFFLPAGRQHADSIQQAIGNQFPTENERLLATFRYLRQVASGGQLSIKHLVELSRELRQYGCEEEKLADELKERHLWVFASRLMQLMSELTGLTEGFMPIPPTNDRTTRRMIRNINNYLKI